MKSKTNLGGGYKFSKQVSWPIALTRSIRPEDKDFYAKRTNLASSLCVIVAHQVIS